MTFKSEYSESLKKGSGEYWKQFLATTYETTNKSVHKTNLDYQVRKEAGFCGWMKKQQLCDSFLGPCCCVYFIISCVYHTRVLILTP